MMLEVQDLCVSFGSCHILRDVGFSLAEGQWLMIVGPNGAGKSTLLRAVMQHCGYTGRILFDGRDVRTMRSSDRARCIGALAQNHSVGYGFSVEEIVRLGRFSHRENNEEAIAQALALTGMAEKRRQSVLTLSGGEVQRTFLSQVLAQNPKLLLLDEPTNHLDLVYQKEVFALIGQWLKTPGRAVISVVHDLSLAKRFGTDALLLQNGAIIAHGSTEAVLSPERLDPVYQMDVAAWMRQTYAQWEEKTP